MEWGNYVVPSQRARIPNHKKIRNELEKYFSFKQLQDLTRREIQEQDGM
jgi:hypothetical protein